MAGRSAREGVLVGSRHGGGGRRRRPGRNNEHRACRVAHQPVRRAAEQQRSDGPVPARVATSMSRSCEGAMSSRSGSTTAMTGWCVGRASCSCRLAPMAAPMQIVAREPASGFQAEGYRSVGGLPSSRRVQSRLLAHASSESRSLSAMDCRCQRSATRLGWQRILLDDRTGLAAPVGDGVRHLLHRHGEAIQCLFNMGQRDLVARDSVGVGCVCLERPRGALQLVRAGCEGAILIR